MTVAVLREVRLYGPLRAQFGRSHWLAVDSPAEAVRALCVLLQGFRQALAGHTGPGYRVLVGEGRRTQARDEQTLHLGAGRAGVIRIAPVIHGGKRAGVLGIVLGVAILIAAPYLASAIASSGGLSMGAGLVLSTAVQAGGAALGKALILGGIIQLLSPQRTNDAAARESSYLFNGPVNVTQPGGPVPLVIGRMIVGSVTISAGMAADEIELANSPGASNLDGLPAEEATSWLNEDRVYA